MGNFNRGGGGFGGGNRGGFGGGRPNFRRDDRGPVTMTKVTCDACKKPCEVPFKPTAGKPVYCNDCFRSQGAGQDRAPRRDFNDRPTRPSFPSNEGGSDVKRQLELLNSKIDKMIVSIENLAHTKSATKTEVVKSMTVSLPKKEVKKIVKKKGKK